MEDFQNEKPGWSDEDCVIRVIIKRLKELLKPPVGWTNHKFLKVLCTPLEDHLFSRANVLESFLDAKEDEMVSSEEEDNSSEAFIQ